MAIDSVAFKPKVLVDVSSTDASWDFFGKTIRLPVALAPVGSLQSFESGGGASVAKGAGDFGVPMILSSVSEPSMEKVAESGSGPKVFQLYVRGDDAFIDEHAERAIKAGYDAFAITVDTAVISRRERDVAKRWLKPWQRVYTGMEYQAGLSWEQIKRFKAKHKIPLIIKGISRADDAVKCVELGVDVIYVSNHGGRQLDHAVGSFEVLPEIIEAVKGRAKVWVDGGFSRGSDVLKAIALGADLVVLGRLYLYGLASVRNERSEIGFDFFCQTYIPSLFSLLGLTSQEGAAGVTRILEILEDEVHENLALLGAPTLKDLDKSFIAPVQPVVEAHVHSAFPLLRLGEGY